ncbi:amino acid aminotransferase [Pedobacter yulinensis]|uniref:branched-chain-amino-acid transaminase n=1 Tax=Pedobacter yulinensis TaxID=2126353 RepID=A0A2T3HH63_9SPHI|nr:aminotransferase class IV [Pedobacter yulinensis]PST81721.1 amino acid aminotransferase [Pedobacter yulinensis]
MRQHDAFVNGQFIPEHQASLPISDLALQRGYGVFDFLKTIQGKAIFLTDHLDRFYRSAASMRMDVPLDRQALEAVIHELMRRNSLDESGIKLLLTGGTSTDGYSLQQPSLVISQSELQISTAVPKTGLSLRTYAHQRQLPGIKTIDYLQAILLQPWLQAENADDVLYLDGPLVRECPRANLFLIKGDQALTPENQILAGVTRKKLLTLNLDNLHIAAKDFTLDELLNAEEAFICSSTKLVFPVCRVDHHQIGSGRPGPVTLRLREKLLALITEDMERN